MNGICSRVKELRVLKDLSQLEFAKRLGVSRSTISQIEIERQKPDYTLLASISNTFNISYKWLIEGVEDSIVSDNVAVYKTRTDRMIQDKQLIPLFDIEAVAGLVPLFEKIQVNVAKDHLYIPHLPKCDGAVFVTGDSMYPILKSGDIVCYKIVKDPANELFWGEMYLLSIMVSGEEYISVKYVQKSEFGADYVRLVSQNQHHQDKDVKISAIKAIALVKATIRINNM